MKRAGLTLKIISLLMAAVWAGTATTAAMASDRSNQNGPSTINSQMAPDDPRLVIEAGGHTALIGALRFTADGRSLISVSDDKTIRVWSVSADGKASALSRTIRGQIGVGRAGQVFAADLSPPDENGQQQWLAVGGYLSGDEAERNAVRIHDFNTGEVYALLKGHTDNVLWLAFSPSGNWLASAGKDQTIRLWNMKSLTGRNLGNRPIVLKGHRDRITGLAWSPKGDRLASASYDGTIGLWNTADVTNVRIIKFLAKHRGKVRSVTFHPSGATLASGGDDKDIRLWRADNGSLEGVLARADHALSALAFSPDGNLLLTGNFPPPKPNQLTLFNYPSGKTRLRFRGHDNLVMAAAFHPSGRWIASGGGDRKEILLWQAETGKILSRLQGKGRTVYAAGFTKDGRRIIWGQSDDFSSINNRGPMERQFDLEELAFLSRPPSPADIVSARTEVSDVSIHVAKDGDNRMTVKKRGRRLTTIERGPVDGFWHSAYTLTPDARSILSGGQFGDLRLYTLDGTTRCRLVGHTGMITAVSVSTDGRWALSGANDQTVKLWDLGKATSAGSAVISPTLSLFPTSEGEWIAWTPGGYFAASATGAKQIGYSINQGVDKTAEFVSVDQLYDRFYRPDLVLTQLHGDPGKILIKKDAPADIHAVLAEGLAPRVTFVDPAADRTFDPQQVEVQANIIDQGGGIGKVVWKINETTVAMDSHVGGASTRKASTGTAKIEKKEVIAMKQQFDLLPGRNTIEIVAFNRSNEIASLPALLNLTAIEPPPLPKATVSQSPPAPTPAKPSPASPAAMRPVEETLAGAPEPRTNSTLSNPKSPPNDNLSIGETLLASIVKPRTISDPTLNVMVVGVNRYRDKALQLKYAVQDAQSIADMIRHIGGPLFKDVKVTSLFDDQVTMQGLDQAFLKISRDILPQDVFLFYLAGHGVTRDGRYYYLPYDFRYIDDDAVRLNAINQDNLQNWLAGIPARKSLVLIDTCESGSFSQSMVAMRGMAEKAAIAKLTRATGRATIVASTDKQPAAEGYQGHGVFTYVLLKGMQHADEKFGNRDGYTGLFELAAYVNDQVPAITMNAFNFEQIPQVNLIGTDFPIGVVSTSVGS